MRESPPPPRPAGPPGGSATRLRSAPAPRAPGISSTKRSAMRGGRTVSSAPQTTSAGFCQSRSASRTRFIGAVFGCSGSVGTSSGNASAPAFDSGVGNGASYAARTSSARPCAVPASTSRPMSSAPPSSRTTCAEAQPRLARRPAAADAGVEDDEPLDALRVLDGEPQPDRAAPVVDDERQLAQVELLDEPLRSSRRGGRTSTSRSPSACPSGRSRSDRARPCGRAAAG